MSLPYRLLAVVLGGLFLFLGGFHFGKSTERNAIKVAQIGALEVAIEKHDQAAAAGRKVEKKSAIRAARTEAVFSDIQQGVVTHAKTQSATTECSLDPDGLRLWRSANDGAGADAAGNGDDGVRAASAAGEREHDGSADESRDGGQAVSPMSGPSPGADRMAGGD